MNPTSFLVSLMFWFAQPADITVVNLPPKGVLNLSLMPPGKADFERQGTVSRVRIEIDRPQLPGALAPGMNTYVAWAVSPEGEVENIGELAIAGDKVRFETTTRFDQFGLLVTAEPHYMVDRPGAAIAYRNQAPREPGVRRQAVVIEVGAYDYSKLPAFPSGVLPLAAQARSAFEIARAAQADRWAEAEFRLARVALDTMEEMLKRAAPPEIFMPPANESIRRSQRAFVAVRERVALDQLEAARTETAGLRRDRQELAARIEELLRQQAGANDRIRKLESDAADAARENGQLSEERTQALARIQAIERDLEELRQKPAPEKPSAIRIPDVFVDAKTHALTPTGRDALSKIVSTANLWNGAVRVEAAANIIEVIKEFFAASGIPPDRVIWEIR